MQSIHAQLIADIQQHAAGQKGGGPDLPTLIARYYADTDDIDLSARDSQDWYGALLAHMKLAAKRQSGELLVRVYNPNFDDHRWQTSHTVIELVCDDKPFLVDTVSLALARLGCRVHQIIHPVLTVSRDSAGKLQALGALGAQPESWMHIEIGRLTDCEQLTAIEAELVLVLGQLAACIADFRPMLGQLAEIRGELAATPPCCDAAAWRESMAYLDWMLDEHFVFLGYRDYLLKEAKGGLQLAIVKNSGLGLLRGEGKAAHSASFAALPAEVRAMATDKTLLLLTKTNSRSTIHRGAYLDCVGIKRYDANGKVIGERRFLGLYTAKAYNTPPHQIPVLRNKIAAVMAVAQVDANSHKGKSLLNVLDTYPRDELLEIGEAQLAEIAARIVAMQDRSQVRAFIREDVYRRYVSALLYLPRDNYNTDVRIKLIQLFLNAFNGSTAEFTVSLSDAILARVHFIIRTPSGVVPPYDPREIEARIGQATRRWSDDLQLNLVAHAGEERGMALYHKYANSFPPAYYAEHDARVAVYDIEKIEQTLASGRLAMKLNDADLAEPTLHRFKIFRADPIALSDSLPVLENLGVRVIEEQPYSLRFTDGSRAWVTDIAISLPQAGLLDDQARRAAFQEGFAAVFEGRAENDRFNRLISLLGLEWREVVLLRAYARYLKQVGLNFSHDHIADCLAAFGQTTREFVAYFRALHAPEGHSAKDADALLAKLKAALAQAPSLDDERILSGFFHSISATVRTNYFQPAANGEVKDYLSFKLESGRIPGVPQPVPLFEIFVCSPRVEGVHLRFGKVARGGLRWSDRREDFRTEVLGLVKAQQVKNTVIVPVGSKGGFVLKQAPAASDREAFLAEGVACYKTFIRGLLDLTDNLVDGKLLPPPAVVRHDADDPYLVVAADKGTATFSDIANGVSQEYGFWLDDAFASGGSQGYDHKKMGITARGAWESVKRHFRELGHDTQTQPFTVAGIGDLMGDVFGNGMLLSEHIELVAAFNHQHIFLDPKPDTAASFKERQRMFALPRSSWDDYDKTLISAGGGIFPRSAKSIPLSPEVRQRLGISDEALPPNALIRAILMAPVDLIYNGGIGTYFKASTQSHAEAADRANDALRVDGCEIRARVIGEGGNLGFTQLGRVEYALAGGHLCTDAIDNSAGVDCSDHEVNIKILLGRLVQAGDLTQKQRNQLLVAMTDDVGALVLHDNYLQTAAISLELRQFRSLLSVHMRFMQSLEKSGRLSRRIEYLPNDAQIAERQANGQGLSGPELAVLLAYAKLDLSDKLMASPLPDRGEWDALLTSYFPPKMVAQFGKQLPEHSLRREIVATQLTNACVNRMGITFVFRVAEETNAEAAEIVYAWSVASHLMQAESLWQALEALDNRIPCAMQYELMLDLRRQIERIARWVLRLQLTEADAAEQLARLTTEMPGLLPRLPVWLAKQPEAEARRAELQAQGLAPALLDRILYLDAVPALLDIARLAHHHQGTVDDVAHTYFHLEAVLQIHWLREVINALPRDNRWQTLARMALRDELYGEHAALTARVLASEGKGAARVEAWLAARDGALQYVQRMFEELRVATPDLAMVSAAMREIRNRLAA